MARPRGRLPPAGGARRDPRRPLRRGLSGEQFALPEAVETLRALKAVPAAVEELRIAAVDPLNLVGVLTPGPRIPAVNGHEVIYRNGAPLPAPIRGVA